jgi:hypothetical protein
MGVNLAEPTAKAETDLKYLHHFLPQMQAKKWGNWSR